MPGTEIGRGLREEFADVVKLAAMVCETQIAILTFVGDDTAWIVSSVGTDLQNAPRDQSFCASLMCGRDLLVVPDAQRDPRFVDNAFVAGAPHVRFYAGTPLISPEGVPLGGLGVIGLEPRQGLTETQTFALTTLAAQIMQRLESRRRANWRARVDAAALDLTAGSGFIRRLEWNVSARADAHASSAIANACDADAMRSFLSEIHDVERDGVTDAIEQSIRSGRDMRIECRFATPGGERRSLIRGRVIGVGELRFVGVATDLTAQREAERLSVDNENRFHVLADTMPQMVWSTRADGHDDYYNARWYEFTGVLPDSADGDAWSALLHPDDRERAWTEWRHSLATGAPYEVEYRLRQHDGVYRWCLGHATPMRDERGEIVRWFGTCTDIHETRQAAEERELVAHELSHRIKNTFLVISGLIGLYARHDPAMKLFARELRDRVIALGRAHSFVRPHAGHSSPSDTPVTLQGLIAELTEPYRLDGENRIALSGDDLPIDDRAATPMALLIHELATDAAKYGSLSVLGGHVEIAAALLEDQLVLTWTETGGPSPESAPTEGFGTRVSRLSVESQLGGTLTYLWKPEGLQATASVPRTSLARLPSRLSV